MITVLPRFSPRTACARLAVLATLAMLGACTTPFPARVEHAQSAIFASFQKIGYSPRDIIGSPTTTPHVMRGRTWFERQIRFRDKQTLDYKQLSKFFDPLAKGSKPHSGFDFEYDFSISESESDIERVRSYDFKLDRYYTIYRVDFVRSLRPEDADAENGIPAATRMPESFPPPPRPVIIPPGK